MKKIFLILSILIIILCGCKSYSDGVITINPKKEIEIDNCEKKENIIKKKDEIINELSLRFKSLKKSKCISFDNLIGDLDLSDKVFIEPLYIDCPECSSVNFNNCYSHMNTEENYSMFTINNNNYGILNIATSSSEIK